MKRIISMVLSAVLCFAAVFCAGSDAFAAESVKIEDCGVGDIVEFGSYPQSEVKDELLLSALNELELNWVSYGYYAGNDAVDGTMTARDYMKYADVEYNGEKYRAVTFSKYRRSSTAEPETTEGKSYDTFQFANGYFINNIYWFKFEPIEWRVLDNETGLVMCESLIDSQPITNFAVKEIFLNGDDCCCNEEGEDAGDWETSFMREWLNDGFYNTAFSSTEKNSIAETTNENKCSESYYSDYDRPDTTEKVFLLSVFDVINADYGFDSGRYKNDTARLGRGTDYAECQGLYVYRYEGSFNNGCSYWWLRNKSGISGRTCDVYNDASCGDSIFAYHVGAGVRPAITLNPSYCLSHNLTVSDKNEPTCVDDGYITRKCSDCDYEETEILPATHTTGHVWNDDYTVDKEPTYTEAGSESIHCSLCSATKDSREIPKLNGTITVEPYQDEIGYKEDISFFATTDVPDGKMKWYDAETGEGIGEGKTFTAYDLEEDISVYAVVYQNGKPVAESEKVTVTVRNSFFDKLLAFFREIWDFFAVIC